ncbi:hypothetical protein HAX54_050489 [Datura stramonium]|uniref:Uncharacterized protein n=1 Tax=Datura stramonium TaxID=4076 RepID=A0ABS8SX75_DATST|nr:hypothetical protein [Datura stramonium]
MAIMAICSDEIIKYLWQFVVTKNIQKKRDREELEESGDQETQRGPEFSFPPHYNIFAREESSTLQQYGDLVGILGSQGSNIGSTYYRPGLEFNDGDHHAQNDYNLNIATYSVMSDTDNGDATTNNLGVANANCRQYVGETSMSHPNNIFTTTHANENEGSESNEIDCDAYIDLSNIDDLFQKIESRIAKLPNEHGSKFD